MAPPLFRFYRDERAVYSTWRQLIARHSVRGKPAHDARLVAAMNRHGLKHILTFNTSDFVRYLGIQIIDPRAVASPIKP